jgi:protein O-mannosyl-transferase
MTTRSRPKSKSTSPASLTKPSLLDEVLTQRRAIFLIVAVTVLVYTNSLSGKFVFDDTPQIAGNPSLNSWSNLIQAFTSDVWSFQRALLTKDIPPPYYRPLFTAYLTINYKLFGLWEPGWHLMNLLVHSGATVLVYFLIKRLSADRIVATLAALIFGLHPAHVESVSWISGIPDPLAALFYIPSLIWYIRYRTEGEKKWLAASLVAYGLSALCKETPLALPLVFVFWELVRTGKQISPKISSRLRAVIPQLIPYAAVGALYLGLRYAALGRISWKHPFMAQVPDSAIWMTVPYVLVSYLQHLIAPIKLSLIYGTSFVTQASDPRFLVPAGVLLALAFALWAFRRRISGEIWITFALFIVPLIPVLNLRVFHFDYIVQDRYLYLPSIGFCYLVAILIARLSKQRAAVAAALSVIVIMALGIGTVVQNRVWQSPVALWQRAVHSAPASWSSHYNLGLAYLNRKEDQPALDELMIARRLNPTQPTVLNNLALAQNGLGQQLEAIETLKQALRIDPTLLEAHNNLGTLLFERNMFADAEKEFNEVLAHDPSSNSARFNLARTLAAQGKHEPAIRNFQTLLATDPKDVAARYELVSSYVAAGRKQEAVNEFNRAQLMDRDQKRIEEMKKKFAQVR